MPYENLSALDAALDMPRIEDRIPRYIEARAKELFEHQSQAITGHTWVWGDSSDEIRNKWRLEAFVEKWKEDVKREVRETSFSLRVSGEKD